MINLPRVRFAAPPVYFMHIPKTAGSSLRKLLFSAYRPKQRREIYIEQLHRIDTTTVSRLRCISSHLGPSLLPFIEQPGLSCITMLREPVERTISGIYYSQQRMKDHPHIFRPEQLAACQPFLHADLRTWLDHFGEKVGANHQTFNLGRTSDLRAYFKDGAIGGLGQPLLQPVNLPTIPTHAAPKQIAENAHKQLEQMAVVGIAERFRESAVLVADLLGIPIPQQPPTVNVGPRKRDVQIGGYRATVMPDLIERLEAAAHYDRALYAHACELFAEQWARYRARPRRTISLAPRLYAPIAQARQAAGQIKRNVLTGLKPALARNIG